MKVVKLAGFGILAILLAIPPTFFAAIASVPLLRDVEERWSIEAIGHSGPADWVIWTIWLVISALIAGTIWLLHRKRETTE